MNPSTGLLQKIASGDCVVFVGAGLSQGAGLPGWKHLLKAMVRWCEERGITLTDKTDIEASIDENKFLLAAEELVEQMGTEEFDGFISEVCSDPRLTPTEVHLLLIQIPFAAAITTNYDKLLESAYSEKESVEVFTQNDVERLSNALRTKKFYILKSHGTADRPETIVLTRSQYRKLMHENPAYREFLATLFSTKTVLFIGFSLNDPDLELELNELQTVFSGYTGTHYALMNATEIVPFEQKRWASDYNIEIIPYTPSADGHPEVKEFLQKIMEALPRYILFQMMNEGLRPVKQILDSDSHYRIVMDTDGGFTVHERYKGASEDKPLAHSFSLKFDDDTAEGREGREAFERTDFDRTTGHPKESPSAGFCFTGFVKTFLA